MKQTRSALSMLLKAYRSVFTQAWAKGLAGAVILTAGLSAGAAQAADPASLADALNNTSSENLADAYTVSGTETLNKGGYIKGLTITGTLNASSLDNHIRTNGDVVVNGGTLSLTGASGIVSTLDDSTWNGDADFIVNNGTVTVTKSQIQMANVTLNNAQVTIGTNIGDNSDSDWADNAMIGALGSLQDDDTGVLTVEGNSVINLNQGSNLWGGTVNLNGGVINLAGTESGSTAALIRAYSNGTLNIDGSTINVEDGDFGYVVGSTIVMDSGVLNIGGTLTLAGAAAAKFDSLTAAKEITVNGGSINVQNGGNLVIAGTAAALKSSVLNNAGTISVVKDAKLTFVGEMTSSYFENNFNDITEIFGLQQDLGEIENNGTLVFKNGIYTFTPVSSETTEVAEAQGGDTNQQIIVEANGALIYDTVDEVKALGNVDIIDGDVSDQTDGLVAVTASHSVLTQDLFGDTALHSSNSGGGTFEVLGATIDLSKSSGDSKNQFDTHGIELCIDEDATLHVAAPDEGAVPTLTITGATSEIGFRGDVDMVVGEDATRADNGLLKVSGGADVYFENWLTHNTLNINVDLEADSKDVSNNRTEIRFVEGNWQAKDITLSNGGALEIADMDDLPTEGFEPVVTVNTITNGGEVNVYQPGTLNVKTIAGDGAYNVHGVLSLTGDGDAETLNFNASKVKVDGTINLNDAADTIGLSLDSDGKFSTAQGYNKSSLTLESGLIQVNLSNVTDNELSIEQANTLLGVISSGTGRVSISGAAVDVPVQVDTATGDNYINASDLAADESGNISLNFDTEETRSSELRGLEGTVTGGFKNIVTAEGNDEVVVGENGSLGLYGTSADGKLASTSTGDVAGVNVNSGTLDVNASGMVGSITGGGTLQVNNVDLNVVKTDGGAADITVDTAKINGGSVTAGKVATSTLNVEQNAQLNAASVETGNLTTNGAAVSAGSLSADFVDLSGTELTVTEKVTIGEGTMQKGSSVTAAEAEVGDLKVVGSSKLIAQNLVMTSGKTVRIGSESSADEENGSSTGALVANVVSLNGGALVIDPEFNEKTATAAIQSFSSKVSDTGTPDMKINGDIIVGRNSALGVGMTEDELKSSIAGYQSNGALVDGKFGSVLMVNTKGLTLGANSTIVVGSADVTELTGKTNTYDGDIYFGKGGSMVFTARAMALDDGEYTIKMEKADGNLVAGGGQIVLPAGASADQIAQALTNGSGTVTVEAEEEGQKLYFTTANGLYTGTLGEGQKLNELQFTLNANDARSILSGLSDAMYTYTMEVLDAENFQEIVDAYNAGNAQTRTAGQEMPLGLQFVQDAAGNGNGSALETAARLAAFGGAVQAANLVQQTTSDAIAARAGIGAQSNLTISENNGFALWFAPVYKMQDSDGFDADGLDAGADVDLYGAALGADFTFMDSVRVGAMFNLGSGSADGQDAGSAVDNDFDYYSLAVYAGFSPVENLDLLADVSYSCVDNDIDAQSGLQDYGKLSASADSTAISVGLTAQYQLALSALDVTPHVGVRYTRLDLDDYHVNSDAGRLADVDSDSMSIVSVPVGVTLSRDFEVNGWSVSPAFDLTLTGNFGDDEFDNDVTFTGVQGYEANLSTEVIDSFTYGASLGVAASNGSFSFGLGVNYTGSENTDSFGVSANVGYRF